MSEEREIPAEVERAIKLGFHLQVVYKNHLSQNQEPKATISSKQLFTGGSVSGIKLSNLRKAAGNKIDKRWKFCLENRAVVEDTHSLVYYLSLFHSNIRALVPEDDDPIEEEEEEDDNEVIKNGDEKKPAKKGKTKPSAPKSVLAFPLLTAYVCVEDTFAPDQAGKTAAMEWLKENRVKLDMDKSRRERRVTAPEAPESHKDLSHLEFAEYDWTYEAPTDETSKKGMLDCAVDAGIKDWEKIFMLNKTLYAFDIRGKKLEVTNARVPAFKLKYADPPEDASLPEFVEIFDNPSIEIAEIETDIQSSLVNNAFSAKSLETLVGGGSPLISASISAGIKAENEKGTGLSDGTKRTEYHASYLFPRVKLFFDEHTLDIGESCKAALLKLQKDPTIEALKHFQHRYGVIFATEIVLGGRLETTKFSKSRFQAKTEEERDALKAALGANFSAPTVSASISAESENETSEEKKRREQEASRSLSWTARGGDTLLCANPPKWAGSVCIWRNWRVIQQDEPVTLQALIGRFEGYAWVPELFEQILNKITKPPPAITAAPTKPPKVLDGGKAWTKKTQLRLLIDGGCVFNADVSRDYLTISQGNDDRPQQSTFSVYDADPEGNGVAVSVLRADYPISLLLGQGPEILGQDYNSVSVNDDGLLQPQAINRGAFRFSLRRRGASGPWQPDSGLELPNGSKAWMFCHSIGKGPWRSIDAPPSEAYQAYYSAQKRMLVFAGKKSVPSGLSGYTEAEFTIEYV